MASSFFRASLKFLRKGLNFMQLCIIQLTKQRATDSYVDFCEVKETCIQQSDFADNDWFNFLKPMADYMAQEIFI